MRWRLVVPVVVLMGLIILMGYGLTRRPDIIPSALIGKTAPAFDVRTLASDKARISDSDLKGQVTLVNVWASWCVACRAEHGLITEISRRTGVPVVGLNYKDTDKDALRWLGRYGNPFAWWRLIRVAKWASTGAWRPFPKPLWSIAVAPLCTRSWALLPARK